MGTLSHVSACLPTRSLFWYSIRNQLIGSNVNLWSSRCNNIVVFPFATGRLFQKYVLVKEGKKRAKNTGLSVSCRSSVASQMYPSSNSYSKMCNVYVVPGYLWLLLKIMQKKNVRFMDDRKNERGESF